MPCFHVSFLDFIPGGFSLSLFHPFFIGARKNQVYMSYLQSRWCTYVVIFNLVMICLQACIDNTDNNIFSIISCIPRCFYVHLALLKYKLSKIQQILSKFSVSNFPKNAKELGSGSLCVNQAGNNYMLKVNNRNTWIRCEICSKLTITLRKFQTMCLCFYCYFWEGKRWLWKWLE